MSAADLAAAMLAQSEDCIKLLSIDGHLDFMNCNGLSAMQIEEPHKVIGKLWWELWPETSQALVQAKFREAAEGIEASFEAICPTAKGASRRWSVNLRPLFAKDGPVVSILCTSRQIPAD
ncbi:PAS domain-containing protein [Aurantiacibacter suaedae]|uniref:PAS domain-containing protein n=1 Tax=Aurantiacibacter suaedae TaxID=2545755 RepID=UPI001F50146C|nr:PAS domain-containing protein [Aurantiacibacter suaedae]